MRPIRRALVALVPALLVAACASSASPSPSTPASEAPASAPPASVAPSAAPICARSADAPAVEVAISGFTYDPDPVVAKVGQVIAWTNQDGAPHTASLDSGACATTNLGKGASDGLVFAEPGEYTYFCAVHGKDSMAGRITIEP